ncbi:MAG: ABC transporter permease [Ignavibacteria bacterium]
MNKKFLVNSISVFGAIVITLLITILLLVFVGKNPFEVLGLMIGDTFFNGYGFGQMLFKATSLMIVATGLAICFQAAIFNIGAEGNLYFGSFISSVIAVNFGDLPPVILLPFSILAGIGASMIVSLIPPFIKVRKGVSEVITTIMLNFVFIYVVNYFVLNFFAVKATVRMEKVNESLMFMKLSSWVDFLRGSSVNILFFVGLAISLLTYFFLFKTKMGYAIRAVGLNETASRYMGIKVNEIVYLVFLISGGLSSIAGLNFVMGYKGYFEIGFSANIGFTAIAVSLLAKNNPVGIIFSSLLFGFLDYGGLAVNSLVPKEVMFVVQGVVILSIIAVDKIVNRIFQT